MNCNNKKTVENIVHRFGSSDFAVAVTVSFQKHFKRFSLQIDQKNVNRVDLAKETFPLEMGLKLENRC